MAEWMITALIQGVGLAFMAGMVYQGHQRMSKDIEGKADAKDVEELKDDHASLSMEFRGLDRRVTKLEPRGRQPN